MAGALAIVPLLGALAATPGPTPCAPSAGTGEVGVAAGARLRAAPAASAPSVAVVDADVTLPVTARCGAFAEVRWGGVRGWVRPGDTSGPSLERAARTPDAARLAAAYNAMRPLGRDTRLGPWRLVTDVATGELRGLDAVALNLADAYRSRTGLPTAPGPDQAVVIFASDTRYRAFARADGSPMLGTRGHAGAGLAAFAMGRNPLESRVILVHELTHLLSRNALGEAIPAWLDEGLAEDLGWCRVDAAGRLQPDTLDLHEGTRGSGTAAVLERSGPRVTADAWRERARAGRIPPLAAVLAPESRLFSDPGARRDAATASGLLVRWCLAEPARAETFREFLRAVSLRGAADFRALAASLGLDEATLSKRFLEWVTKGDAF